MSDQVEYETEFTLKIKIYHWGTTTPEQAVNNVISHLGYPAIRNVELTGDVVTTPEWPWEKVDQT
jgi:hypothetical protein